MENKKEFTIGYSPMDREMFYFHMDFSHELSREHNATLALVDGVNMIKKERYHVCIQKLPISPVGDLDLMYSLGSVMRQFKYRIKGLSIPEAYNRGCDLKKQLEQDPMANVIKDFIKVETIGTVENTGFTVVDNWDKHNMSEDHIKATIEDLEDELLIAVSDEKYEVAAEVRDKIKKIKKDLETFKKHD